MTTDPYIEAIKKKWQSRAHDGDGNPRGCEVFMASDGYPSIGVSTEHPLTEDDIDYMMGRMAALEDVAHKARDLSREIRAVGRGLGYGIHDAETDLFSAISVLDGTTATPSSGFSMDDDREINALAHALHDLTVTEHSGACDDPEHWRTRIKDARTVLVYRRKWMQT